MQKPTNGELLVGGALSAATIGGAALALVRYNQRRRAENIGNPDILNAIDDPLLRRQVNLVAAVVLTELYPTTHTLTAALGVTRHKLSRPLGYARDANLVEAVSRRQLTDVPAHFEPTESLVNVLEAIDQYPVLQHCLLERPDVIYPQASSY